VSLEEGDGLMFFQQDSLGKSISLKRRYTDDNDVWAGPLSDGSTVVRESTACTAPCLWELMFV
jgi:alpha-galactosidase